MKNIDGMDKVDIVLEATMDELFKIREMAGNLKQLEKVHRSAMNEYDKHVLYTRFAIGILLTVLKVKVEERRTGKTKEDL